MVNNSILMNVARQPIDHMFLMLGRSMRRNFKERLDRKFNEFRSALREVVDRARSLAVSLKLKERNFENIGVHAADQQENGRAKLRLRYTDAQIDAVVLTPEEKQFYDFMRAELDKIKPQYEKMLKEVFNLPLGEVVNYFPFMTDYTTFSNWTDEVGGFNYSEQYFKVLKKTVDLSAQKKRTDVKGNQNIKINALNVFEDHMEAVLYAIHLADDIKMLQELANTDSFREIAGNVGQRMTREWLDLMARMGWSGQKKTGVDKTVDFLRKAMGAKALVANPNSILLQTTAMMDGAGLIGHYAFAWQLEVTKVDGKWRNFALDESGRLKERFGDDVSFREMGNSWFDKLRSKGYSPQRWVDSMVATGVWIGAYNKYCDKNGITADTTNANSDAVAYADKIVTMTQASSEFIDSPLLLSKGIGFGDSSSWAKLIFQFQTPLFARYANLVDVGGRAWKEGDKKLLLQIAGWNAAATVSEMAIRHGTKALTALIFMSIFGSTGAPDDDKDENVIWELIKELYGTVIGNIPYVSLLGSTLNYGSVPIPVASMIIQALDTYKWYKKSEDPEKKFKWGTILALQASAITTGLPPDSITRIIKAFLSNSSKNERRHL
jgi:hypothetical protein